MSMSFVLIKTKPGKELHVYSRLTNEPEIKEVYPLFGEFDFLVKIIARNLETIGQVVINKIRIIDGVIETITLNELPM
jgi:DNA-binding Lrp family transcriptional regulator